MSRRARSKSKRCSASRQNTAGKPLTGFIGRCAGTRRLSFAASTRTGRKTRSSRRCAGSLSMPEPDLIELFVHPLGQLGVRYLVSGSVAAMLYGEPRVTHDVDLIVFLRYADIPRLSEVFPAPEFYLPPPETIGAETTQKNIQSRK